MIKPCPNCLRHTETELVPAVVRTVSAWFQGVLRVTEEIAAPPYLICTHCGWSHGYVEVSA